MNGFSKMKILYTLIIVVVTGLYLPAAYSADTPLSEKVTDFSGGSIYKVKENGALKDVVVYDDGTTETINPSQRVNFVKKDRMSAELKKEQRSRSPDDTISVTLWLREIDTKRIDDMAKQKNTNSASGNLDKAFLRNYTEKKRMLLRNGYTAKIKNFRLKSLSSTDNVIFASGYTPFILVKTTVKNLANLSKNSDVVAMGFYGNDQKSDEVEHSIPNVRAHYTRDTLGLRGSGVKVGIVEMGYPDKSNAQLSRINITFDADDTTVAKYVTEHATKVTSIIAGETQGIAPDATVYVTRSMNSREDYQKIEWLVSQGCSVINYSAGNQNIRGVYSTMAKWIDYLVYQYNVIFVKSSGNVGQGYGITDPGMAYNGITIGSIFENNSPDEPDWLDDLIASGSCYQETEGGYKPDLTAPGQGISVAGFPEDNGTSFAAPHATGIIAQLMSSIPELKTQPAAISSILKSGTMHQTADDYGIYSLSPYISDKEGAGVVDAQGAYSVCNENKYVQVQLSNDQFPYQKFINVKTTSSPVRVSITWLMQNSQSSDSTMMGTLTDLDLYVYDPDGTLIASSESANNNSELVQFTPSTTGAYKVIVTGYSLANSSEILGFSWKQ
jgi:serine protease AprX